MVKSVIISVNNGVFQKDPNSSELGLKILKASIDMIDDIGFESFTFRKLAASIGSTEASVYRYFESKHRLLIYLTCWYWGWIDYRLILATTNIDSPQIRLGRAIDVLVEQVEEDSDISHIDEVKLNRIIISESSKAFLNKFVDEENKEGFFQAYKDLVARVSDIIIEIAPNYKYPHMLVSSIIESGHVQRYFADHLPKLTDNIEGEDSAVEFSKDLAFKILSSRP